jgi:Fur family ferric uptake transcriptional regulator
MMQGETMEPLKERIDNLLDSAHMKRTGARRTVLEVLLKSERPKSAEELISVMGKAGPNKVTVYRTLDSMVEAGLVHRAFLKDTSQYYEMADKCTKHQCHPHFVCKDCGQTRCMPEVSVPMATNPPAGFIIERQQVRLEGLCPDCS